jgi:Rps23 Pro-64 3,4-dihydroxylase Tpa1-like proline 4-hydroxylase
MAEETAWPLPPYVQLTDFLPAELHSALLDWVLANEEQFRAATVANRLDKNSRIDPDVRIAQTMREVGPSRPAIEAKLLEALPALIAATGVKGPEPRSIELELAAHGDGAHYGAHLDIPVGEGRRSIGAHRGEDRVLSGVYYFYNEPRGFSGGALRFYRFNAKPAEGPAAGSYVDVEPLNNSLVAFPSWATHEVRRVSCPSEAFRNYRFALNCWYCRKL